MKNNNIIIGICKFVGSIICIMCLPQCLMEARAEELLNQVQCQYNYEVDDYGNNQVVGFEYNNEDYHFIYDERGIISEIVNDSGEYVAHYECSDEGIVSGIYFWDGDEWIISTNPNFLGHINKVRWLGYEYEEISGYYLIGGSFYDPILKKYTDGVDNSFAYAEVNPCIPEEQDGILIIDSYYDDMAAQEWADLLLEDSTYGTAISYSSGWYSNLSTVELLARCIYCEGGTTYTTEGNAVAWVILNRVHSSSFPGTPREVITASGQFSSVIGGSGATEQSREPAKSSSRWRNATYLACLMLTTTDTTSWSSLVGNQLNGQLYFYAYTTAKNSGNVFSGSSSDSLYYGNSKIKDVYVMGYGSVTSFPTLFTTYSPIAYSRNIYYNFN